MRYFLWIGFWCLLSALVFDGIGYFANIDPVYLFGAASLITLKFILSPDSTTEYNDAVDQAGTFANSTFGIVLKFIIYAVFFIGGWIMFLEFVEGKSIIWLQIIGLFA